MARIVFAATALNDLGRIVEFLLQRSERAAEEAYRQIRTAIDVLSAHPRIGRRVRGQLRALVITHGASGYIALYRFDAALSVVRILRIRHQREAGFRD